MARPSKRTDDRKERLLGSLRDGTTRRAACAVAGISEDTLGRWLEDPDMASEVKRAEGEAEAFMAGVVLKAAKGHVVTITKRRETPDGVTFETQKKRIFDVQAAQWWLARRGGDEWRDKSSIEVDGAIGVAEELVAIASALRERSVVPEPSDGD